MRRTPGSLSPRPLLPKPIVPSSTFASPGCGRIDFETRGTQSIAKKKSNQEMAAEFTCGLVTKRNACLPPFPIAASTGTLAAMDDVDGLPNPRLCSALHWCWCWCWCRLPCPGLMLPSSSAAAHPRPRPRRRYRRGLRPRRPCSRSFEKALGL